MMKNKISNPPSILIFLAPVIAGIIAYACIKNGYSPNDIAKGIKILVYVVLMIPVALFIYGFRKGKKEFLILGIALFSLWVIGAIFIDLMLQEIRLTG